MFQLISRNYGTTWCIIHQIITGIVIIKPTKAMLITSTLCSRWDYYAWGTFLLEEPPSKDSNYPLIPPLRRLITCSNHSVVKIPICVWHHMVLRQRRTWVIYHMILRQWIMFVIACVKMTQICVRQNGGHFLNFYLHNKIEKPSFKCNN